jgi:serralysin
MAYLTHIQSLWSADLLGISQVADIYVRDGAAGPVLVMRDATAQTVTTFDLTGAAVSASAAVTLPMSGSVDLLLDGSNHSIDAGFIGDLATYKAAERGYLDGSSFAGLSARFASADVGGETLLFASRSYGQGISTFSLGSEVSYRAETTDSPALHISGVTGLAVAPVGPAQFLVAASGPEDGLSVMRIGPGGALEETHSVSTAEGVPIDAPSGLLTIEVGGETYVVLSASGSGSLTVFQIDGNGRLTFADQVSDTLKTRFQGATAIDAISYHGRSVIAVGGNDGGLSLLQLLPGGQLLHLETIIDQTGSALSGIRDLQFVETASGLQIFALTTGDQGLGQFAVNLPPENFVFVDASGSGVMAGTAGADIFVLRPDGAADEIAGFDPGADKIDLSIFDLVASEADIGITETSDGARLLVGGEMLTLHSTNGAPITVAMLADSFLFDLDHTSMSDPGFSGIIYGTSFSEALHGSAGDDRIESRAGADWTTPGTGNDVIDGGAWRDMVSYFDLDGPVWIDLAQGMVWGPSKIDHLISIEGATGSIYADYIEGDAGANRLRGLGGTDWFIGSGGGDSFDGGVSRDMVSYAYAPEGVTVDLAQGKGLGGLAAGDTY